MNPSRRTDVSVFGWAAFLFFTCPDTCLAQVQPIEIPVRDFNAIPDDGINDLGQIRAAVAAIPPSGNAILMFEPGVYDLDPKDPVLGLWPPLPVPFTVSFFELVSKPDITIAGNGAVLLCKNFTPTLHLRGRLRGTVVRHAGAKRRRREPGQPRRSDRGDELRLEKLREGRRRSRVLGP